MTAPTAVAAVGSSIGAAAVSPYTAQLVSGGIYVFIDATTSTPGDHPIVSYTFSAGDGSAAVGPQVAATSVHKYNSPGVYPYSVRVIDSVGGTAIASQLVHVSYEAPSVPVTNPEGTAAVRHPYIPLDPDNPSFMLHRPRS